MQALTCIFARRLRCAGAAEPGGSVLRCLRDVRRECLSALLCVRCQPDSTCACCCACLSCDARIERVHLLARRTRAFAFATENGERRTLSLSPLAGPGRLPWGNAPAVQATISRFADSKRSITQPKWRSVPERAASLFLSVKAEFHVGIHGGYLGDEVRTRANRRFLRLLKPVFVIEKVSGTDTCRRLASSVHISSSEKEMTSTSNWLRVQLACELRLTQIPSRVQGGGKAISGSFPYFDFQNGGSREGIFEGECDGSPESQKVALVAVHLSVVSPLRNGIAFSASGYSRDACCVCSSRRMLGKRFVSLSVTMNCCISARAC